MTETVEPKTEVKSKLEMLLKSRKFWAALVGLLLVVVKGFYPDLPLDDEMVTNLIYILIAYITGTAIEDGLRAKAAGG